VSSFERVLALEKTQMDLQLQETLHNFTKFAENLATDCIQKVILVCLKSILPTDKFNALEKSLDERPTWQNVKVADWDSINLDMDVLRSACIHEIEETIQKDVARLRQAEYKDERRESGENGSNPDVLGNAAKGAAMGAGFGPWGSAIGGAVGFVSSLFGGRSKTKVVYVERVQTKPAEIYYEKEDVKLKFQKVNYDKLQSALEGIAKDTLARGFLSWYGEEGKKALESTQKVVDEHYKKNLNALISSLEQDIKMFDQDAETQKSHMQKLNKAKEMAEELITRFSKPVETLFDV